MTYLHVAFPKSIVNCSMFVLLVSEDGSCLTNPASKAAHVAFFGSGTPVRRGAALFFRAAAVSFVQHLFPSLSLCCFHSFALLHSCNQQRWEKHRCEVLCTGQNFQ
jgi:hypothetical protein